MPVAYTDSNGNPLTARQLAENYGYAWSFLKQHSDVWHVFTAAVSQNYSVEKFKAAIQGTNWWKKTQASVRQYQLEVASDPKSVAAKQSALFAQIQAKASAMGATASQSTLQTMAKTALMFGWNDVQVQQHLGNYVTATNGIYHGQAATDADSLKQLAWRNGLNVSANTLDSWVKGIAGGKQTTAYYNEYVRNQAKALAPSFAGQLDAGMDLYDIASPYIQAKASILQQDPNAIDLFDPDIRQALGATTSDGKPTSMSLWQFEQNLRSKPEYMKTDTARDSAYSIAHKVLNDFGLMGG